LCDATGRWAARVRADGSVIAAEHKGSIHAVAARVQGAAACNGWAFWHVRRNGRLVSIDAFRQALRAEMG
jgi:modification methylase